MSVETGSLNCLGCGHEHNCGIHGCTVLRAAADRLEAAVKDLRLLGDCAVCVHDNPVGEDGMPCITCRRGKNFICRDEEEN